MTSVVTDLADELIRCVLNYLPHADGKARFGMTGHRAHDIHALTLSPGFATWASQLSDKQRRWVAGLTVAPPIRAGFESGEDCQARPHEMLQELVQNVDVIGRLVAYQATLFADETAMWQEEDDHIFDAGYGDSFSSYFDIEEWESDSVEEFSVRMSEMPVVFIALGFLTDSRIEELLEAKLDRERWSMVFDYRSDDANVLVDTLFSFAEWGAPVVTGRYEMTKAVKQHGRSLKFASDALKADRTVVLAAVNQEGIALQYISEGLRADRDIAMDAVRESGNALVYVSAELKADRSIAMAAVKQSGWALEHVPAEVAEFKVVMLAVTQTGFALQFASGEMKNNFDVVAAAVAQNRHALRYASAELQEAFATDH